MTAKKLLNQFIARKRFALSVKKTFLVSYNRLFLISNEWSGTGRTQKQLWVRRGAFGPQWIFCQTIPVKYKALFSFRTLVSHLFRFFLKKKIWLIRDHGISLLRTWFREIRWASIVMNLIGLFSLCNFLSHKRFRPEGICLFDLCCTVLRYHAQQIEFIFVFFDGLDQRENEHR